MSCSSAPYFSAEVMTPPFAAVAAIERASMRATEAVCPSRGFEPSRFGKFLVVWRRLKPRFAGVSPAPKHGPQKAVLTTAPADIRSSRHPFAASSIIAGWLPGYTESGKPRVPRPLSICAAATTLSNMPPEQPAIIPWSARISPFFEILSVRPSFSVSSSKAARASSSTFFNIS